MSVKRWIPKIAICFLLGLVTTVAVAWTCAAWVRISYYEKYAEGITIPSSDGWLIRAYRCSGAEYVMGYPIYEMIQSGGARDWADDLLMPNEVLWIDSYKEPLEAVPEQRRTKVINARGWPVPALWCELLTGRSLTAGWMDTEISGGVLWDIDVPLNNRSVVDYRHAALPFRPLWKGLLIDTFFYAALWYLICVIHSLLRRKVLFMTRRVIFSAVVASLVASIFTTIGVSWLCALWIDEQFTPHTDEDGYGMSSSQGRYAMWSVSRDWEPGALRLRSSWSAPKRAGIAFSGPPPDGPAEDFVPYWTDYLSPGDDDMIRRVLDARGWPMLAMWGGFEVPQHLEDNVYIGTLGETTYAIVLPRYSEGNFISSWSRVIPLAPIWFGFAVDTLFYAAIWLFLMYLLAGPGIIKRTFRHSRGYCIRCGYDLHGMDHDKCPECGAITQRGN